MEISLDTSGCCELVPKAVSDRVGTISLHLGSTNAMAGITVTEEHGTTSIDVETVTLDSFAAEHPPPDCIKVDIEGAEGLALAGATDLLSTDHPPVLLIEFHGEDVVEDIKLILAGHGYRLTSLRGAPVSFENVDPRGQFYAVPPS